MKKTLHFSYDSVENIVRMTTTMQFEKSNRFQELGWLWHQVFDDEKGDALFKQFIEQEYPDGATIGVDEIYHLMGVAVKYLESDRFNKERSKHTIMTGNSWLYCKTTDIAVKCDFGEHESALIDMLNDLMGESIWETREDKLAEIIQSQFIVASANTTLAKLAADAQYIKGCLQNRQSRYLANLDYPVDV